MGTKKEMLDHPFLQGLSPKFLETLADCAREAFFKKDQLIFREGDQADQFFLVQDGSFSLELYIPNQEDRSIQTIHGGELLGWGWILPPYRWTCDVRSLEDSRAFAIDARCIRGKCHVDHEFGYQLHSRINEVIAQRMKALRLQLIDIYAHE